MSYLDFSKNVCRNSSARKVIASNGLVTASLQVIGHGVSRTTVNHELVGDTLETTSRVAYSKAQTAHHAVHFRPVALASPASRMRICPFVRDGLYHSTDFHRKGCAKVRS